MEECGGFKSSSSGPSCADPTTVHPGDDPGAEVVWGSDAMERRLSGVPAALGHSGCQPAGLNAAAGAIERPLPRLGRGCDIGTIAGVARIDKSKTTGRNRLSTSCRVYLQIPTHTVPSSSVYSSHPPLSISRVCSYVQAWPTEKYDKSAPSMFSPICYIRNAEPWHPKKGILCCGIPRSLSALVVRQLP